MKKRLVSLLLAFSMMLTFMPVGAVTAVADKGTVKDTGYCGYLGDKNIEYTLTQNNSDNNNPTYTLALKGSGRMRDYPGYGAPANAPWMTYAKAITQVQISDGIASIGSGAFIKCSSLTEIGIPDSVTSIGYRAFKDCTSAKKISIPSGVISIGEEAFMGCSALKDIGNNNALPVGIKKLEPSTFFKCSSLQSITLPEGLLEISDNEHGNGGVFEDCKSLTSIVIPKTVTKIGTNAFDGCSGLATVTFEKESSLASIGLYAFYQSGITGIEIPDTVTSMGTYVFSSSTSLKKVTFPKGMTEIPEATFYGCTALSDITLNGQVTKIGKSAFSGCYSLKSVANFNSVVEVGNDAFSSSGLTGTITLPSTIKTIGNNAFGVSSSNKLRILLAKEFSGVTVDNNAFSGTEKIYYPGYKADWNATRNNNTITSLSEDGLKLNYSYPYGDPVPILYLCKVTFKNGDTVLAQSPATDTYRTEKINTSVVPTVEGLEYWYTDPDDPEGSKVNLAAYEVPDDVTLYAKAKTHVNATISIAGPDNTNVKAGEPSDSFTVTVTENDDTGVKTKFTVSENVKDLQYSEDNGTTWKSMTEDELNKEWSKSDLDNKQFRVVPKNDAEAGTATVTVKLVKDNGAEAKANFNVAKRTHAAVAISGLSGQLITTKSHEFTVTVTPNDDVGEATLNFDDVTGLTYEGEAVTSAGVKLTDFTEAKTFTLTPTEASDSKDLNATLTTAAGCTHDGTANYTVRAYKGAEVEINWKDNDNSEVKPGDENGKEFVVKVTPNDDGGKLTIDVGKNAGNEDKIEYKDTDGKWKELPGGKLTVDLDKIKEDGKKSEEFEFRVVPKDTEGNTEERKETLTVTVKQDDGTTDGKEIGKSELNYTVAKKDDGGNENPNPNPGGGESGGETPNPNPGGGESGGETPNPNPGGGESGGETPDPNPGGGESGGDNNNPGGNTGDNTDTDETKNWETITVEDGSITKVLDKDGNDITEKVTATKTVDETSKTKLIYKAPAGAKVTVKANDAPENMKFKMWVFSVANMNGDPNNDVYSSEMTFTVPKDGVIVSAMYESADIDDGGYEIIGPIVIGGTIVAGSAALGYQTYSLVTDFLGSLYGLPYFPSNRSALALMLWENAGKPEPESDILYPDVGWEEQDMDLQHAARWAMEHELLPDKNDKNADLAPEEVKFFPNDMITKASVLKAWMKALELKKAN